MLLSTDAAGCLFTCTAHGLSYFFLFSYSNVFQPAETIFLQQFIIHRQHYIESSINCVRSQLIDIGAYHLLTPLLLNGTCATRLRFTIPALFIERMDNPCFAQLISMLAPISYFTFPAANAFCLPSRFDFISSVSILQSKPQSNVFRHLSNHHKHPFVACVSVNRCFAVSGCRSTVCLS